MKRKNRQAPPEFIAGVLKAAMEAEAKGIMTPEADAALTEYLLGQDATRFLWTSLQEGNDKGQSS